VGGKVDFLIHVACSSPELDLVLVFFLAVTLVPGLFPLSDVDPVAAYSFLQF